MLNQTTATQPKAEQLTVAFQDFNGVFIAKISNLAGKETHAYGATKQKAEENAMQNFNRKYHSNFQTL